MALGGALDPAVEGSARRQPSVAAALLVDAARRAEAAPEQVAHLEGAALHTAEGAPLVCTFQWRAFNTP